LNKEFHNSIKILLHKMIDPSFSNIMIMMLMKIKNKNKITMLIKMVMIRIKLYIEMINNKMT